MRVPMVLLAVPYLAGSGAALAAGDTAPAYLIAGTAAAALLSALAALGFLAAGEPWGVAVAVAIGGGCAGYGSTQVSVRDLYRPSLLQEFERLSRNSDPLIILGELRDDASGGGPLTVGVHAIGRPGGELRRVRGGVRLYVGGATQPEQAGEWRAGRTIRCAALLRVPGTFYNPGLPDDRKALARRGIALTGTIKSAALVEVVGRGTWLDEGAASIRAYTRDRIARHVGRLDARSAAVATAILIGDRTGLSDEDERRLQDAGTYHVIAISGGNIAILAVLLLVGFRACGAPRRAAAVATIGLLLFYGEVAGGAASVGRAITAAVLFLAALTIDHRGRAANVLAVAAAAAIAVAPVAVVDAGFLLSFGATLGIILGVPLIGTVTLDRKAGWRTRTVRRAAAAAIGMLAATVCAELALAPIAASLFSRATVAGLALNFLAIPLMAIVQCGSLALLAVAELPGAAASALGILVHYSAWGLVESARLVDVVPWVARDVSPPAWWVCALYYACALAAVLHANRRVAWLGALAACGAMMIAAPTGTTRGELRARVPGWLRIVVLDVGQGDAILVQAPGGRQFLVDAGGLAGSSFDIGTRVVLPALRALGAARLDALVLTHGDPDHVGGAEPVVRRLRPDAIWEGVAVPPHLPLRRIRELADAEGLLWRTVRPGVVERAGAYAMRVLHPPEPDWERQRVRNDDSIVLELRFGSVSVLLPGDIGRATEESLVPLVEPGRLVILKAAHHGSATSTSAPWLDALRPAAVLFSAGRNNRFGHPAAAVLQRVDSRRIPHFSTSDDGALFVETDGRTVEVWGWATSRRIRLQAPE